MNKSRLKVQVCRLHPDITVVTKIGRGKETVWL